MIDKDSLTVAILFIIAFVLYYIKMTRSLSGHFIYFDKRKNNLTLRLSIFGTPREMSDLRNVISSLKQCLQDLEKKNYHSVTFASHLITDEMIETIQRFTQEQGYALQDVRFCYTSKWQRFIIPLKMLLFHFTVTFANPTTTTFTVVFNQRHDAGFDNIYVGK